jgi:hypothetical protein
MGGAAMSEQRPAPTRPTYRELWYDVDGTLLDIWESTTQLDAESLCGLWNHLPVPRYMAERAIYEYNQLFKTSYTLDQVDIPTLEALGYGRQFHIHEGEITMGVSWTWVKL